MASTLAATSMIEIDNPIATVNMGIALIAGITAFLMSGMFRKYAASLIEILRQ